MLHCSSASYRNGRSLLLDTAFHSPAATTDLSTSFPGRVNAPGLHLRKRPDFFHRPVRLFAPAPVRFFTPRGARSTPSTRRQLPISGLADCFQAFTPLQDLSILPDHSAPPVSNRLRLTLTNRPIFLRSPQR